MKKSIIALAVAGAMTAPMIAQADATLYGSIRVGVNFEDDGNENLANRNVQGDNGVADQSSRIGIKGDVDLGLEGTKGLFHFEWQAGNADNDSNTDTLDGRLAYAGAKGAWGKLTIGAQWAPHSLLVANASQPFHPGDSGFGERFHLGNSILGEISGDASTGIQFLKRTDSSILYTSPKFGGGFQFHGMAILRQDGSDNDGEFDEDVDGYNALLSYKGGPLKAALSIGSLERGNANITAGTNTGNSLTGVFTNIEADVLGLAVGYKVGGWDFVGRYETLETTTDNRGEVQDQEVVELLVRYTTSGGTSIYARASDFEDDAAGAEFDDLTQYGIGIKQQLGKGRVFAEYIDNDSQDRFGDRLALGYRLDF